MGQYYIAVILGPTGEEEFVRAWIPSGCGSKLMEHSYLGNPMVATVERLMSPIGAFWRSRLVWAGDYADEEVGTKNLYHLAQEEPTKGWAPERLETVAYRFYVNHTKKEYVDKGVAGRFTIAALPLLTAEGNGRGGGDFRGIGEHLVGTWARDEISVELEAPAGYTQLVTEFRE